MAKKNTGKKRVIRQNRWCICTEGKTEAIYLDAYCRELGVRHLIDINAEHTECKMKRGEACGRQHLPLISQMKSCHYIRKYACIIAIHDYDKHHDPKKGNATHVTFDDASQVGKDVDIHVFYTIPSFEYWLLLHHEFEQSDLTRAACLKKVFEYTNRKRKECGKPPLRKKEDVKTDPDLFSYFGGLDGVQKAMKWAEMLLPSGQLPLKPSSIKPSTNMHVLMEKIQDFAASQFT